MSEDDRVEETGKIGKKTRKSERLEVAECQNQSKTRSFRAVAGESPLLQGCSSFFSLHN